MANRVFTGTIKGKTIKLDEDPRLPAGEIVEVRIAARRIKHLEKALGGWRDDPGLDSAFRRLDRNRHRRRISEVET